MSEEGYKPSAEEIQSAEGTMTRRQVKLTEANKNIFKSLEELGMSPDTISKVEVSGDAYFTLTINGHKISQFDSNITVDGAEVDTPQDAIKLRKIIDLFKQLFHFHHSIEGSHIPSDAIQTIKPFDSGYEEWAIRNRERNTKEIEAVEKIQEALDDIFK